MRGLYEHLKSQWASVGDKRGGSSSSRMRLAFYSETRTIYSSGGRNSSVPSSINSKSPTLDPDVIDKVRQRPETRASRRLGAEPDLEEVERAVKDLHNWKASGHESLPAELLKIDDEEPIILAHIRAIVAAIWIGGAFSQEGRNHQTAVQEEGPVQLSHVGKVPVKIITNRLSAFCEVNNILPEEQGRFRPGRSTVCMLLVVRRSQELKRRRKIPIYMCFVGL